MRSASTDDFLVSTTCATFLIEAAISSIAATGAVSIEDHQQVVLQSDQREEDSQLGEITLGNDIGDNRYARKQQTGDYNSENWRLEPNSLFGVVIDFV